jgi:hypothetical protein
MERVCVIPDLLAAITAEALMSEPQPGSAGPLQANPECGRRRIYAWIRRTGRRFRRPNVGLTIDEGWLRGR